MSSALPYLGAFRDVAEPWGLSACIACSEVYVVTSGGAEWFSVMKHITGFLILMAVILKVKEATGFQKLPCSTKDRDSESKSITEISA